MYCSIYSTLKFICESCHHMILELSTKDCPTTSTAATTTTTVAAVATTAAVATSKSSSASENISSGLDYNLGWIVVAGLLGTILVATSVFMFYAFVSPACCLPGGIYYPYWSSSSCGCCEQLCNDYLITYVNRNLLICC